MSTFFALKETIGIDPRGEVELIEEYEGYIRIRVRELTGKASVFISVDQLEQFATKAFELVRKIERTRGIEPL